MGNSFCKQTSLALSSLTPTETCFQRAQLTSKHILASQSQGTVRLPDGIATSQAHQQLQSVYTVTSDRNRTVLLHMQSMP